MRYKKAAGGYAGVVTWTPFASKADFDIWFAKGGHDQEVVEEGISTERAIRLALDTPLEYSIAAAREKATDPKTGAFDEAVFRFEMQNVTLARIFGF
ncbi:MAG: hypothetical protein AAB421_02575 [Patescibacteria group bacterium]